VPTALSDEELDVLIERFDALVGRSLRRAVRAGTSEALTASVKFHQVHDQRTHGHGDVKSVDASSSEALHDAAQAHFKETASDDVKRSRLQYMGGGYEGINRSLRGHREMDANSATAISGMDEAFRSSSVRSTSDVTVTRSLQRHAGLNTGSGAELVEDGFMSTSANGYEFGNVRLDIKVPAGTPVLGGMKEQGELILNRGTRYKITGKSSRSALGAEVYDAEVIS
jgi:hypothetical protein